MMELVCDIVSFPNWLVFKPKHRVLICTFIYLLQVNIWNIFKQSLKEQLVNFKARYSYNVKGHFTEKSICLQINSISGKTPFAPWVAF